MRILLPVFLALSMATLSALAGNPQRADAFLRRGAEALEAGEVEKAADLFEEARKADPELPQPEIMLGHIHMSREEFDIAESCFERAIDLHRRLRAHLEVETQRRAQEAEDQRALSTSGLEQSADQGGRGRESASGALQRQAQDMRDQQAADRQGGIERREGHSSDEPDVPADLFMFLGNARVRAGRPADAAEAYREAVARAPDAPEPHHNLAVALAQSGQLEEALENCRIAEALEYEPSLQLCPQILAALQPTPQQ